MPQLNPSPWFLIFVFAWMILLVYIAPKVLKHFDPKLPTVKTTQSPKKYFWSWPSL